MSKRWNRRARTYAHGCVWACIALGLPAPALAISLGTADTFEGGVDGGWSAGAPSPVPPVVVPTGGPAGTDDGYLQLRSVGGVGPGSRLAVIAGAQWTGDYQAAGVDAITLDLNNFGTTDLSLRLWMSGSLGGVALSSTAVSLPAGSGWVRVGFALDAASLTGDALGVLSGVTQLRLYHGSSASFPGEALTATLGVDNITAVPELPTAALLLPGLAALCVLRRRASH